MIRTLVWVNADARMDQFEDNEGKVRTALNLVARRSSSVSHYIISN